VILAVVTNTLIVAEYGCNSIPIQEELNTTKDYKNENQN
jgi:hypothetical protein